LLPSSGRGIIYSGGLLRGIRRWSESKKKRLSSPEPCVVEINNHYGPSIYRTFRRMRWAGHVARMGEERGAYRVLVRKPEGKRPLGRPRLRWVDNIRMDL